MRTPKAVCQSCGAPLLRVSDQGTERSGGHSDDYCRRCYAWGKFVEPAMTVEGMREDVRKRMADRKLPGFLAILLADRVYHLKRWKAPSL